MFRLFSWQAAFGLSAVGSAMSLGLAYVILLPAPQTTAEQPVSILQALDFRPVWQNRSALAYILAYACHMWEMFAARSWLVAFMTFSISLQTVSDGHIAPTTVMAIAGIFGMLASIGGGELATRFDRRRTVSVIMLISCVLSLLIGFSAELPYAMVVLLCFVYTIFFQGDSAAIHAGVITAAEPHPRGPTMAVPSTGGFSAPSLGSVAAGFVLDLTGGGETTFSWGLTFASLAVAAALGPIILKRLDNSARPPVSSAS